MGIFDSIKNAFSSGKEDAQDAAAPAEPPPEPNVAAPAGTAARSYTVESGDSLWKIAESMYGDGAKYTHIFEANREVLEEPDRILPGQVLKIPPLDD